MTDPSPTDGHRARLRDRWHRAGSKGFADHELLELLLTYVFRRTDTKPLAKRLLERFHGLKGVLDATPAQIQEVAGAGPRAVPTVIQLDADVSALVGRAQAMVTRLSGGLAHWARQLEFTPHRLRVTGTAGSGKTQLALAEYRAAIENEVFVTMIYLGMLRRAPDPAGFAFWVGYMDGGNSRLALIESTLAAPEYRLRFLPP